ncbi:MAG TPA: phytanoyl-CoA dioxygenase family protein [Bryobacteraceae bacterium]|jgi:phytanoyl-CoA hydroxylase|nr:phytanoyl-CoA dioxygenase family protein [Bryobacteraceae bacterium]
MHSERRQQFDRDGFLILRSFLTAAEVNDLETGLRRFVREIAPGLPKAHVMYEDYDDPDTIKQADCLDMETSIDAWRHSGKIRQLAEELLGPVHPQHAEYFDKPPGNNKGTPPHQDGFYFCLSPNEACTFWIPLDEVDADNGALTYVRGSRHLGLLPHNATSVLGFSQGLARDPSGTGEAVLASARRGDVLVHHSLTVHYAGRNKTERRRRSVGFVFFSADARQDDEMLRNYREALERQRVAKGLVPAVS